MPGRPTTGTASTNSTSKPISAASAASSRRRAGSVPIGAAGQVQVAIDPLEVSVDVVPPHQLVDLGHRGQPGVPDRLGVADAERDVSSCSRVSVTIVRCALV